MNSLNNFVWDCYIKSFENKDSLIEATVNFTWDEKKAIASEFFKKIKYWENIYENRVKYLLDHVKIIKNGIYGEIEYVEFHCIFGWTVKNNDSMVYLGKSSFYEGVNIKIGRNSFFSGANTIRGIGKLVIGSYCSFGFNLYLNVGNQSHPINYPASIDLANEQRMLERGVTLDLHYNENTSRKDIIKIGNDVWIGHDVEVFNMVEIGCGCVIGAYSLVTKNCEPYGVYVGKPARLIKFRFRKAIIDELLDIRWWDWSESRMKRNLIFFNTDLTKFKGSIYDIIVE